MPVREFYEIMPSDIGCHGGIQDPKKVIDVEEHLLDRAQNQSLQTGDILLAIKGSVGKVGIISSDCGENWIAGQSFVTVFQVTPLSKRSPLPCRRTNQSHRAAWTRMAG